MQLQLDLGEWPLVDQLALCWRGLTGEYLLVILATIVLTLMTWPICQHSYLIVCGSVRVEGSLEVASGPPAGLYGQAASSYPPYLEPASADDEAQAEPEPSSPPPCLNRCPRKLHAGRGANKMSNVQESGTQTTPRLRVSTSSRGAFRQGPTTGTSGPRGYVHLIRRIMVARSSQLLFYSNGIQLQRIPRYLLDRISEANLSVGRSGPVDREWPRWSSAGIANLLDHTSEGDYVDACENLRLYQAGLGRYASNPRNSQRALESSVLSDAALAELSTRRRWPDPTVPLPAPAGVTPGYTTPEQLQRTASYLSDLREKGGQPRHELRPGELPAPRTHASTRLRRRHAGGGVACSSARVCITSAT